MSRCLGFLILLFTIHVNASNDEDYNNWQGLTQEMYFNNLEYCQYNINKLKWSYNIWPIENQQPKPKYEDIVSENQLRTQVIQKIQMESVLNSFFGEELDHSLLQKELDRIALHTKDPEMLKQYFQVLDNDPRTIVECLIKPNLIKKRLIDKFNWSEEIHHEKKAVAYDDIEKYENNKSKVTNTAQSQIIIYKLKSDKSLTTSATQQDIHPPQSNFEIIELIELSQQEFDLKRTQFTSSPSLQETELSYTYRKAIENTDQILKVNLLVWQKTLFSKWFKENKFIDYSTNTKNTSETYILPKINTNLKQAFNSNTYANTWKQESPSTPEARYYHSAVWTGTEMIIWGGYNSGSYDGNDYLKSGGRYNPATDTWAVTNLTNTPSRRGWHKAIWTGSEMIVWGGYNGSNYLNTGSRYNPTTNTWTAVTNNSAPNVRYNETTIWTGSEMIIWGGENGSNYFNTGARFNPINNTWTAITTASAPVARSDHTAVWTDNEMIVWGGYDGTVLSSGAKYNPSNNTWTSMPNAPIGRYQHTAIWTGMEMIQWGGIDNGLEISFSGGRYNLANNQWSATTTLNAPDVRRDHTAVWTGTEMIIWGGSYSLNTSENYYLNSGGHYSPSTDSWVDTSTTNSPGTDRKGYSSVWTNTEMIIWGGYNNSYLNNGKRYNPDTNNWTSTTIVAIPRNVHTAIWTGNDMIIWGGGDSGTNSANDAKNSGAIYSPYTDSWTPTPTTNAPSARWYHTAIWTGSEMVIWGGWGIYDNGNYQNTGARYNPLLDLWTTTTNTNAPTRRYLHSAIWTGTEMIVWGGWDGNNNLNTGGRYNISSGNWTALPTTDASTPRRDHTAIWTGTDMIIFGGDDDLNYLNTGNKYNPANNNWSPIPNAPRARRGHTAIWTGSEMVTWGGYDGGSISFGGRFDPALNSWVSTSGINAPNARFRHTAVWTDTEMIVWGGRVERNSGNYQPNSGARYNVNLDLWTSMSEINQPRARGGHSAVWTGDEMIVWGGRDNRYLNTTGAYYPYGEEPEIEVQGNGQSILSGSTSTELFDNTSFGTLYENGEVLNHAFTILNTGLAPLNLLNNPAVTLTGNNDFTVITQPNNLVGVGFSTSFTISFNPSTVGLRTATVTITSDDTDESPFSFNISGIGMSDDTIYMGGFEIGQGNPTIMSLTANPKYITYNQSTTLTWKLSNNATSCIKTGSWNGAANFTNGTHSQTINNITGTRTYSLQCFNSLGNSAVKSFQVIVGSPPSLNWISASPSTVNTGESSTISWSVSNAIYCEKSVDWSGSIDPNNGSQNQLITNINTDSTFSMQCFNNFGNSSVEAAQVSVIYPPVLSVLTANPATVNAGAQSTISWNLETNNAYTTCVRSGDWSGTSSYGNGANSRSVYPSTTSTYSLQCSNSAGSSVIRSVEVVVENVSVVTVRLNGNSGNINVDSGSNVTVSWTATNSPDSCDFSVGDWPSGTSGTSGSFNVTNIQSDKSYSLTCTTTGIGTSNTSTATISVNDAGVPAYCNTDPDINPANLVRDTNTTVFESETGIPWPAADTIKYISLLKNQYHAMKFTTPKAGEPNDNYRGSIFFKIAPLAYGGRPTGRTFSVSECPGDFRASLGNCLRSATEIGTFLWTTRASFTTECKLEKDKTYYFNFVHAINEPLLNSSTCPAGSSKCGNILINMSQ